MTNSTSRRSSPPRRIVSARDRWRRLREWHDEQPLPSDAAIAAVILAVCLVFPRHSAAHTVTETLFQIALIVPLIWRRRAPWLAFAVIAGVAFLQWLTTVALPADAALLAAVFTLAVHASPRRAALGAIMLMAGVVMASVRWGLAGDLAKSVVFLAGLVVAAMFAGIALRTWRSYTAAMVERTRRLEFERDQQAQLAAAAERSRIAREMHDVIAHNVSIMVTLADGALAAADTHPERAKDAMADVSATGRLALTDMRHLLGVLHPDERTVDREPQPQLSGLPGLIQGVRATGLPVEFVATGALFDVPPRVELTLFRIVQESLTNILKHADNPSAAHVTLTFDAPFVDVHIRDDGKTRGNVAEGNGLGGMRDRAALCGGTVQAGPKLSGGWEVSARVRADR